MILLGAGCADSGEQARDAPDGERTTADESTTVQEGDAEGTNDAGTDDADTQRAILRIEGAPGTEFSGSCVVGSEERAIGGSVPERFVYDLEGRELECEIRKQGDSGNLEIVLTAGEDNRSVQRTDAENVTVNFAYSADGGLSSSTSSTSSGSSSVSSSSSTSSP
jgi:hypothetical protein